MSNEPFLRIAQHLQLQTGNAGEWVDKKKWFHLLGNDFTILQNAPQAPVAQERRDTPVVSIMVHQLTQNVSPSIKYTITNDGWRKSW